MCVRGVGGGGGVVVVSYSDNCYLRPTVVIEERHLTIAPG